jgi:hypothetical protein
MKGDWPEAKVSPKETGLDWRAIIASVLFIIMAGAFTLWMASAPHIQITPATKTNTERP